MSRTLLIDAAHKEETRVALLDEKNRLVEYDIESLNKQTIKGNVYLAKVMRVEPSLQAAFVEYGGNRHGFLAFSEIHPDYFRIPVSDREALEAKMATSTEELIDLDLDDEALENAKDVAADAEDVDDGDEDMGGAEVIEPEEGAITVSTIAGESVDHSDDDNEDARKRRPALHKLYKIQEVIHKNQILLIQVVKEERGQKGAALTTYLSFAGRYCVLMPNSPQAGGISRKISNPKERKNLRDALKSLAMPAEMGLIIRTAGQGHTKSEIKRDATYLMRQWDEIRDLTLQSIAPALIYQEDSIIKRVIRDQYSKDITSIWIEGDECYKSAKAFMKKLLPSHAKHIQQYKSDKVPLFIQHKIEAQIEKMHESTVMLPSGGSIVINPTEALVSIDINSGKATRERHIEETALNTNLEAAAEIARQVRLRDLAGLVVIDFIDMDDRRHVAQVERKVRESFKNDRARVQMGKISPFGLLELSRQRLRPSMLETSSQPCPHCHATGHIRSTESMALLILRSLEEEGIANRSRKIKAIVPTSVAFYILNEKRHHLADIETRHQFSIVIEGDHALIAPHFKMIQLERVANTSGDGEDGIEEATILHDSKSKRSAERSGERVSDRSGDRSKRRSGEGQSQDRRPQRRDETSADESSQDNKRRNNQNRRRSGNGNRPKDDSATPSPAPEDKEKNNANGGGNAPDTGASENSERKRRRSGRRRSGGNKNRQEQGAPDQMAASMGDGMSTSPSPKAQTAKAPAADKPARKNEGEAGNSEAVKKVASRILKNAPALDGAPSATGDNAASKATEKSDAPAPRKRKSWLKKLLE